MARRVLVIIVVLVVAGFLYLGYTTYDAGRAAANGDVTSKDSSAAKSTSDSTATRKSADPRDTIVYPTPAQAPTTPVTPTDQISQPSTNNTGTATPPTADTISPNPPNGMVFSGTGHFQLYRQGNITWRLNTDTGESCIIFATDEEWKKPKVYKAGCGKT
jgi:hypothetical protein